MNIEVIEVSIDQVVKLSKNIPEFADGYSEEEYHKRMTGKAPLILMAFTEEVAAGFKVGYDKFDDGSWFLHHRSRTERRIEGLPDIIGKEIVKP